MLTDPVLHPNAREFNTSVCKQLLRFFYLLLATNDAGNHTLRGPLGKLAHGTYRSRDELALFELGLSVDQNTVNLVGMEEDHLGVVGVEVRVADVICLIEEGAFFVSDVCGSGGVGARIVATVDTCDCGVRLQTVANTFLSNNQRHLATFEVPDRVLDTHSVNFLIFIRGMFQGNKVVVLS